MSGPSRFTRFAGKLLFASFSAGSGVLLLVLLVVAGRALGDETYGQFSFALALATILEALIDFGLKEVATRTIARDRTQAARLVANTFGLKLLLAAGTLALLTAVAFALRPEPDVRLACILLGLSSAVRSFLMTLRHTLNGLERFDLESAVVIADRAFLLTFGVFALVQGHGLIGLAVAFVAGRLAAFVLALVLARTQVGPIGIASDFEYWRSLQRRALPFGAFVAVLNLYAYVDTLLLGILRTDAETGLYSAAYRVYEGFTNVPVILATVMGPALSRLFVTDRGRHALFARWSVLAALAAALPVVAVAVPLARPILTLLFGAEFGDADRALQILTAGLVFVFPLQLMHSVAISVDEERLLLRAGTLGFVLNFAVNLVAIPLYGREGAAAVTVLSEAASLAWLFLGVRRHASTSS